MSHKEPHMNGFGVCDCACPTCWHVLDEEENQGYCICPYCPSEACVDAE
jgi:hypothetical protein